jgi:hypothetical protein
MEFVFSKHALERMDSRCISKEQVSIVLERPDSIVNQHEGATIFSKLLIEEAKHYLYRVFVNSAKNPMLIISVYKTSKIEKYGY